MNQQAGTVLIAAVGVGLMGYITKVIVTRLLGYIVAFWVGFGTMIGLFGYLVIMMENTQQTKPLEKFKPYAFLRKDRWGKELRELSRDKPLPVTMFPDSFVVSDSLDVLIEYVVRDFVMSWYRKFTSDTLFTGQVDHIIRLAIQQLGQRVSAIDWADVLVRKLLPVITEHFEKFVEADEKVRQGSIQQLTESKELDNAVADEFRKLQELHPVVVSKSYEYEAFRKQWLRKRVSELLPVVLQQSELDASIVMALVNDIVSSSVLFPVANMLSDPDFWNQTVLKAGGTTLQDQHKVQKLRKALDQHASSSSATMNTPEKKRKRLLKLSASASSQQYDQFIRGIHKIKSLTEARQTRYYISVQLKRTMRDGDNSTYQGRLERAKNAIDRQVAKLSGVISASSADDLHTHSSPSVWDSATASSAASTVDAAGGAAQQQLSNPGDVRENYTLSQILNDSACSLYFMEFMDQRKRTNLLQFYMTIDSLRDAFEYEGEDADPLGGLQTQSGNENMNNRDDILQIYHTYLKGTPVVNIGESNVAAMEEFAERQDLPRYKRARRALMEAQNIVFRKIEHRDLAKFKSSDLFLKFLASTPVQVASSGSRLASNSNNVDQLQMDNISESNSYVDLASQAAGASTGPSSSSEDFQAVEQAFNDIMNTEDPRLSQEDQSLEDSKELHLAGPGDLGLTEAIAMLSQDIDKLYAQLSVVESMLSKAELTNNTTDLRILNKSKSSLNREIERKEQQRQQYLVQESENSLYNRTSIQIQSYMTSEDSAGAYILYIIEVSKFSASDVVNAGWIVARRYSQFFDLHQHLKTIIPQVGRLDFPKKRVVLKFQPKSFIDTRRVALERYLQNLLEIPEVCRSKAFRQFLSSETFSVDSWEETADSVLAATEDDDTAMASSISSTLDLELMSETASKPFVQPICDVFIQVFGINKQVGNSSWLRGRAVVVVLQQLLGGTIEKKIREIINDMAGTKRVTDVLQTLTNSLWPNGQLRSKSEVRSQADKTKTKHDAQLVLQQLILDTSSRVVGVSSGRYAAKHLFSMYQNEILNAHLVYTCLDIILDELFKQ